MLAEVGPDRLVPLVRLADAADAEAGHLGRQAEPLAEVPVGDLLKLDPVGKLKVEGNPASQLAASLNRSTVARVACAVSGSGISWI